MESESFLLAVTLGSTTLSDDLWYESESTSMYGYSYSSNLALPLQMTTRVPVLSRAQCRGHYGTRTCTLMECSTVVNVN